ncbi:TPA: hypothetical protein ACH3X3_013723 [Trebouxia sp. C0006]
MDVGMSMPFAFSTVQAGLPGSVSSDGEEVIANISQRDQRDSAADFETVLAAANLKIKLAREAEVAADSAFRQDDSKPVVITFLPCCNETEEELSNPLSLVNNPDADAKRLLDRVNMQFYVVVDGQHDDAPETSTLKALKKILNIDEEQDPLVKDRGCNMYHLFRNGFEVFVYVKGDSLMRGKRYGQLMIFSDIAATMQPPPFAVFCIDADVLTGWKDVDAMITTMEENLKAGGIAGNIGINNYHMGNPLICSQLNVYFTAQAVYKAFEGLFGGVKVLPGAFCLLRYTAVESLLAEYSLLPSDDDIQAANELELGEDRFMTCLFLEHGWDVLYEPDAKAVTVVPDELGAWLVQQRRWMNSANIMDLRQLFINLSWVNSRMRVFLYIIQLLRWVEFNAGLGICFVVVAVCEKILVSDPYHIAVGYAAAYVLFLSLSLCLIKKPAKVIYAVKAHAVVVTTVMLGGVVLLLYKVISGADIVLQAMCLAWLSQLMGVTVVHAPLRHWLKLFYASMCTFVLFGLDQVLLPLFCYCQLDNFAWGTRGIDATETVGEGTKEIAEKKAYEVGYKRMRPRTNKRSAFATKCMVLAAYLTVNMGIGCCIAVSTTWFWWVYMMMGILLFLLGVRIIIFCLSLVALVQFSRRHCRQRRAKADRAALELKAARVVRQASAQDMQLGQQQLSTAASAARQDSTQPLMQSAWSSFSAMQREAAQMQLVLKAGKTGAAGGMHVKHQPLQLSPEWCQHSYASHHLC